MDKARIIPNLPAAALLLLAGIAPPAGGQTSNQPPPVQYVPSNWSLKPSGAANTEFGAYRLLFVTSETHAATDDDIDTYNDFIVERAGAGHAGIRYFANHFAAVASTSSVAARDNTRTNVTRRIDLDDDNNNSGNTGLTRVGDIYWLNGEFVAGYDAGSSSATHRCIAAGETVAVTAVYHAYCNFWDGRWNNNHQPRNDKGVAITGTFSHRVWTGSNGVGLPVDGRELGARDMNGNPEQVRYGRLDQDSATHDTISSGDASGGNMNRLYGLSYLFVNTPYRVKLSVANSGEVDEGGTVAITATVSTSGGGAAGAFNPMHAVTIPLVVRSGLSTATGGGTDYSLTALTIPAGMSSGTATLTAIADTIDEPRERVVIELDRRTLNGLTFTNTRNSNNFSGRRLAPDMDSGAKRRVAVTIIDTNTTKVALSSSDASALEGDNSQTMELLVTIGSETDTGVLGRGLATGEKLSAILKFGEVERTHDEDDESELDVLPEGEIDDFTRYFSMSLSQCFTGDPTRPTTVDCAAGGVVLDVSNKASPSVTFTGPAAGRSAFRARLLLQGAEDDDANNELIRVWVPDASVTHEGPGAAVGAGLDGGAEGDATDDEVMSKHIQVVDDDPRGVAVSQTTALTLTEGAPAGTYTVVLRSDPETDTMDAADVVKVTLRVAGDAAGRTASDKIAIDKTELSFTSANWSTPQTVTVTPVAQDADADDETAYILHAATHAKGAERFGLTGDELGRFRYRYHNISVATVTVEVEDDDPVVTFDEDKSSPTEDDGTVDVKVNLSQPAQAAIALRYKVTLPAGGAAADDFSITGLAPVVLTGTLTIARNASSAVIPVVLNDDSTPENDESLTITLEAAPVGTAAGYELGADTTHVMTILDDDTPEFTITAGDPVTEGGKATFTITHANSANAAITSNLTVDLTVADHAQSDFVASAAEGSARVTFGPDDPTATLEVQTVNDTRDEASGAITATLVDGDGYNIREPASVGVRVLDDDKTRVTLTVADSTATEGSDDETAAIDIALNRGLIQGETLTVPLALDGVGAVSVARGVNYSLAIRNADTLANIALDARKTELTFTGPATGATASAVTLVVTALEEVNSVSEEIEVSIPESDTSLVANVVVFEEEGLDGGVEGVNPKSPNDRISITDNDIPGVTIEPLSVTATEDAAPARGTCAVDDGEITPSAANVYCIRLDSNPGGSVTVTPTPGDRGLVSVSPRSLVFTGGSSGNFDTPQAVTVTALSDDDSDNHSVVIAHAVTGYGAIEEGPDVTVKVVDDDPRVTFDTVAASVAEDAGSHSVAIGLKPAPGEDITIRYRLSTDSTATLDTDYAFVASELAAGNVGEVEVDAGDAAASIPLSIVDDDISEGAETVIIELLAPAADATFYTLGRAATHTLTIADDDLPAISIEAAEDELVEGDETEAVLTLTSTLASAVDLEVGLSVLETRQFVHSSDRGTDKTVTIEAGETTAEYTVPIVNDSLDERDGEVTVAVLRSSAYSGAPSAVIQVRDDDPTQVTLSTPDTTADEADPADRAQISIRLERGLAAGEELAVPLLFEGGAPDSDFSLRLVGRPTGVALSGATLTFTGPETGLSASEAALALMALNDSDATSETVTVSIPASHRVQPPRLDATTLSGGASGRRIGAGRITIADDDVAGVSVTPKSLSLAEGGENGSYNVVLATDPRGTATVIASSSDDAAVRVNPAELKFTSGNWTEPQEITVEAVHDPDSANERVTIAHQVVDYEGVAVADSVTVLVTDDDPQVSFSTAASRAGESFGLRNVTVRLSPPPPEAVTVGYRLSGTAKAGEDYTIEDLDGASGTVEVARGSGSAQIPVTIVDDKDAEGNETIVFTLVTLGGEGNVYTVGGARTHTLTVTDDDSAGVNVTPRGLSLAEGGQGEYTVVLLSKPGGNVTVTPTPGDRAAVTVRPASLTFTPGDWDEPQTVTVTVAEDADSEDERVTIAHGVAGYGGIASAGAVVVVAADDDPEVSFARVASSVAESGGDLEVAINLAPPPGEAIRIEYCVAGTATPGADYTAGGLDPGEDCGRIDAARDASRAAITLTIDDDMIAEGRETVEIVLRGGAGYTVSGGGAHTVTITDDERGGVTVAPEELELEEGASGSYTVALESDPGGAATVGIRSGDPRAVSLSSPALVFTSDNWDTPQTVIVSALEDGDEDNEFVSIFHEVTGYRGVTRVPSVSVTVTDDDAAPPPAATTVSISAGGGIDEGGTASFTIVATPAPEADLTVTVTVSDTAGFADVGQTGRRAVSVGASGQAALTVATVDDDERGGDGRIIVTLAEAPGYSVAPPPANQASVAVSDNDAPPPREPPAISFASDSESAAEDAGRLAVALSVTPAPDAAIALNYVLSGTASLGPDYSIDGVVAGAGAVAVPAGATGATILVDIVGDRVAEEDETVILRLVAGSGYTMGEGAEFTLTVTDDDVPGVTVAPAEVSIAEGTSRAGYTVVLDTDPGGAVTVTPSSSDPGAATVSGALIFGSRDWDMPQAVIVSALEDSDAGDETVIISHSVAGYGGIAAADGVTVTVADDEAAASVVSIAAGGAVVEGELAVFRLSASPRPEAGVVVSVTVTDAGNFAAAGQSGARPVMLGPDGTATLTVSTVDDGAEEEGGAIVATVGPGAGYTVAAEPGHSATVEVRDNDAPPVPTEPVASFAAAAAMAGEYVGRRDVPIRLNPPPAEAIVLGYTVSGTASPDADYAIEGLTGEGAGTVEVAAGATAATVTVTIADDNPDEPDETVVLTLTAGEGYTVGAAGIHTLTIVDDDEPPELQAQASPTLARLGRSLTGQLMESVSGRLEARRRATESPLGNLFNLSIAGRGDWRGQADALRGEAVDWLDRAAGWLEGGGPGVAPGAGRPAGFGGLRGGVLPRTDAAPRSAGPGSPGAPWRAGPGPPGGARGGGGPAGVLGAGPGLSVAPPPVLGIAPAAGGGSSGREALGGLLAGLAPDNPLADMRGMRFEDLLRETIAASSFLGLGPRLGGGRFGFWGQGAGSRFEGGGEAFEMDGDLTTAQLGADWTRIWLTLGVMVSAGDGEGRYLAGTANGDVSLTLNSVTPYAGWALGPRASVWGALSASEGELSLRPEHGAETVDDLSMRAFALGGRGEVYAGDGGVLSVSVVSDLFSVNAETGGDAAGLAGVAAEATRLRLALEGAWTFRLPAGGRLEGRLEAGLRGDAGDAEEGYGAEVAGGVSLAGNGLSLDLEARGLAMHSEEAFTQQGVSLLLAWDPRPEDSLGPVATLSRGWGIGTADRLYRMSDLSNLGWTAGFDAGFAPAADARGESGRLNLGLGWGVLAPGGRYVMTPAASYGADGLGRREAGLGWRLEPSRRDGPGLTAELDVAWRGPQPAGEGAAAPGWAGAGWASLDAGPGDTAGARTVVGVREEGYEMGAARGAGRSPAAGERSVELKFRMRW